MPRQCDQCPMMLEDPPCPVHGPEKCSECGEDDHPFISCLASKNIRDGANRRLVEEYGHK